MIREIIKPTDNKLTIDLPEEYIGKEIEYIIFPVKNHDEKREEKHFNISALGGSLKQYADPQKTGLENKAWELHVMEKYSK